MSRQLLAILSLFLAVNHNLQAADHAVIRQRIKKLEECIHEGCEFRRYMLEICNLTPAQRAAAGIRETPQETALDMQRIPGLNNRLHSYITALNRLRVELEK